MVQKNTTASNGRTGNQADRPQRSHVSVPVIGTLALPPPDRLVFYAVLGALGALEIIEWPIALVIGVGHYLTEQRFSPALQEAGQAAEAA
jgi:hypothetical protein